ncbi:hypothetical protein J2X36_003760 [Methylobacterium sp. BE186]|uniref:hypothetical protein n=1 Tax=Methylobacterium sp. BE186 TaxID=2817715 RepID=UPI0028645F2A|nr:hypothetical protein [Methylobacterium sp. BE186]MDR7038988.1 hypothetical protein [Methylobacterium sp. BE186]
MIAIEVVRDESDESIVVALIRLPRGTLKVMAEIGFSGGELRLDGLHVHGIELGANDLGFHGLRRILREVLDELGIESAVVSGAVRTTGAGPGRLPRPLRVTRHRRPARAAPRR